MKMQDEDLSNFTDILSDADEIANSQPISLPSSPEGEAQHNISEHSIFQQNLVVERPAKRTGQQGEFRSILEIDPKFRDVFTFPYFNLVQSAVIEDALYTDKSIVVCAPTGSGKTVVFEMAIVQLLMDMDERNYTGDFKIIYMAPVKALCTERLSEWYPKFTKLGLNCIECTGDTNVDFSQLKPYRIIITTPEKWDMLTRRWRDHRGLVEVIKLFLIDEVHILNDDSRGPVLEAVVSRMKTIESSSQSAYRIEQLQKQYQENTLEEPIICPPRIRFVAVSATISNPEDVAAWLGNSDKPAVFYKFGDECRPVKIKRLVEGYPCPEGMSIFKFDIILNYKLWPIIQRHHNGKPTLIFCNTRKSVALTAEALSRELTISFTPEQKAKLTAVAMKIKNKKLQALVLNGVGCHHAGLLYEERLCIEEAFRNRDLPILITTTTLAMGVNLPAHLVIIKNTQQYVNGAYQEYSITTILQMVGRAGRPQFDTEGTAVIMTRLADKPRYQALVGGSEPLQSYLHLRLAENLNSEAALGTVCDVAQCVQWLRSTFLSVRAAKDPRRYLGLPHNAPASLITKKVEELCVKAMNGLASAGLIKMDEACCIESTDAGRLMSIFYIDLGTMKQIMKIDGSESLERLLWIVCESHELSDMHLRVDERRTLNALNRNNAAATIRFPMKGKISTRQMKLNCIIQAVLGCLNIPDPSLNQEAMKVMRIALRICKCIVAYVTRPDLISTQSKFYSAVKNSLLLEKCFEAHMWENSPYVSRQLRGIGPTFSTMLATAGKVNFTLLEESHPRDLERIMNKGAPAGNVLRKQISFLPKYQLEATPIDEKRVSIKLRLLNKCHIADNRDELTAGFSHKCFVVAGDSENHLLLFTSFKDSDLISIYDGTLTYEITRKHQFEHNISVHCISSKWVGIDTECTFAFKNLQTVFSRDTCSNSESLKVPNYCQKPTVKKQTAITDVYKQKKRKSTDADITQSKEKMKRESAFIEKFKNLKDSLAITSKELRNELNDPDVNTDFLQLSIPIDADSLLPLNDSFDKAFSENMSATPNSIHTYSNNNYKVNDNLNDDDCFVIDNHVNNIFNEIKNDVYHNSRNNNGNIKDKDLISIEEEKPRISSNFIKESYDIQQSLQTKKSSSLENDKSYLENRKRKFVKPKSNYSFIDTLTETNVIEDIETRTSSSACGFSKTIKNQIEQFLKKTNVSIGRDTAIDKIMNEEKYEDVEVLPSKESNNKTLSVSWSSDLNFKENSDITVTTQEGINAETGCNLQITDNFLNDGIAQSQDTEDIVISLQDKSAADIQTSCETNIEPVATNECGKNHYLKSFGPKYRDNSKINTEIKEDKLFQTSEKTSQITEANVKYFDNTNSNRALTLPTNTMDYEKTMGDLYPNAAASYNKSQILSLRVKPQLNILLQNDFNIDVNEMTPDICVITDSALALQNNRYDLESSCTKNQKTVDSVPTVRSSTEHTTNYTSKLTNNHVKSSTSYRHRFVVPYRHPKYTNTSDELKNMSMSKHEQNSKETVEEPNDSESEIKGKTFNRYSYSTTKLDISTKNTLDRQIKIIRKMKLDVDVTEIVTKKGTTRSPSKANKDPQNQFAIIIPYSHFISNSPTKSVAPEALPKEKVGPTKTNTELIQQFSPETDTRNATSDAIDGNNEIKKPKNSVCKSTLGENTNVTNILSKYSTILRKSTGGGVQINKQSATGEEKNKKFLKPTTKPFKISDLNNSDIALPESLIGKPSPQTYSTNFPTSVEKLAAIYHDNNESSQIKKSPFTSTGTNIGMCDDYIENLFYTQQELALTEKAEEFNLDHSLLNPKTLLMQCFSNDENKSPILPPPPEFRNNIEQDLAFTPSNDIVSSLNDYDQSEEYDMNNRIFFEENELSVLTPSKEIETWTLPQSDQSENFGNLYGTKSLTVIRQNYPSDSSVLTGRSTNYYCSKNNKLQKFKFTDKIKFKM